MQVIDCIADYSELQFDDLYRRVLYIKMYPSIAVMMILSMQPEKWNQSWKVISDETMNKLHDDDGIENSNIYFSNYHDQYNVQLVKSA